MVFYKKNRKLVSAIALACSAACVMSPSIAQDNAVSAEEIFLLEELVVTARKRAESIQDVPISVSAFGSEAIEKLGLTDIEDTFGTVPGLYFTGNFLSPNRDFRQLVIRGVGANSQLEPSVATFVDGVYSPALAFDLDFLDLERVEILKGPQGSLFGRNTEGGALNIITRKPSEDFRGKVSLEVDEFSTRKLAASLSGAIAENFFGKVAALVSDTDGFITNNAAVATPASQVINNVTATPIPRSWDHDSVSRKEQDAHDKKAFTGGFLWTPSDSVEISLNADYSITEGGDASPGPLASAGESYEVNADSLFDQKSENTGASLTLDWGLGFADLTLIAGYRELEASVPWDFDGVATLNGSSRVGNVHDFDSKQRITSQEIRLASNNDGAFNWLAGIYFFDEVNNSDRFYNFPNLDDPSGAGPQEALDGLWNEQIVNIDRNGEAYFGQITYDVNDSLELALGIRYSDEEAEVAALERFAIPGANFGLDVDFTSWFSGWQDFFTPVTDSESWDNTSVSFSSRYRINDSVTTYFSYAEGFKAGSYQKAPVVPEDVVPIDPEELESFEIGIKSRLFNDRASLDAAIYKIDITDQQLQGVVVRDGITASSIGNAANSEVQGFEISFDAQLTDNFRLSADYGYVDSEFVDYQIDPGTGIVDRSGDAFPNTPETTYSISAEYATSVGNNLNLTAYLGYRYVDDIYVGSDAAAVDPIIDVPDWKQLDLRLTLASEKWKTTLFVDNLTDEYIILSRWNPFFVQPNLSAVHNRVAPPRRVGINFTYEF